MNKNDFIKKWFGGAESDVRKLQLLEFTEDLQKVIGENVNIPLKDKLLDGIDELLARRESKQLTLRELDYALLKAYSQAKCFPRRWYVKNPNERVLFYLNGKYNKGLSISMVKNTERAGLSVGYGEAHGEFAFVPHDVDYSWEISQKEFDFILGVITDEEIKNKL